MKCKFIDFQICRRGSPVIDLMYFTITSVHVNVFDKNRDTLFNLYLDEFNNTLQEIGVPREKQYTLDDFKTDWEKFTGYFFFVLIGVTTPLWAGDHQTEGPNSAEENHIDELFKSEKYRSAFKGWIKHLIPKEYA